MVIKHSMLDRERIAGVLIFVSLFTILLTMLCIRFLDVKVSNIELVDNGLYTIVTDNGPINIDKDDILRIERTYVKTAMTGTTVEMDRIFTNKGFIYISSLDSFYKNGLQLINSVDFEGKEVWINFKNSDSNRTAKISNELQNANLKLVQPFSYAIGTPSNLTSIVLSIISLQYFALAVGGIALVFLIFPLRMEATVNNSPFIQQDKEYCSDEENLGVVAK